MLIFSIHLKKFSGLRSECQTFRSRSGPTKCWALSGSKLFAKVFFTVCQSTIFLIISIKTDSFGNSENPDEMLQVTLFACWDIAHATADLGHICTCLCIKGSVWHPYMALMTVPPSRKHSGWMAEKETVTNYNFLRAHGIVSTTALNGLL